MWISTIVCTKNLCGPANNLQATLCRTASAAHSPNRIAQVAAPGAHATIVAHPL